MAMGGKAYPGFLDVGTGPTAHGGWPGLVTVPVVSSSSRRAPLARGRVSVQVRPRELAAMAGVPAGFRRCCKWFAGCRPPPGARARLSHRPA